MFLQFRKHIFMSFITFSDTMCCIVFWWAVASTLAPSWHPFGILFHDFRRQRRMLICSWMVFVLTWSKMVPKSRCWVSPVCSLSRSLPASYPQGFLFMILVSFWPPPWYPFGRFWSPLWHPLGSILDHFGLNIPTKSNRKLIFSGVGGIRRSL